MREQDLSAGGVPDLTRTNRAAMPGDPTTYEGCVRRLTVNGASLLLNVEGAVGGVNVLDCDGTQCGHSVCENGGTCLPGEGDNFTCYCDEVRAVLYNSYSGH